jgi:glycosyltransferase involved in cell wall biosynthesis
MNPLVSILTPFKNTARFLNECIDSIVTQTYDNWELVAIDDHSTDGSLEIVRQYAKNDSRIRVYTNSGTGVIEALRMAFFKSRGNLITRMDSDDIMHNNKLKVMSQQLQQFGKNHVAIGLVKYFSERGIGSGYQRYEQWLNRLTLKGSNYSNIYKECSIPSPCWMTYRDDLLKAGSFESDRYPEDYDLAFRFYKQGLICIPSNQTLHYWRDYDERTSRTHEHYALNHFLDIKIDYFLELNYDPGRPLTVWGAGMKGKTVARAMVEKNIPFYWICNNPKKIGCKIYEKELLNFEYLSEINDPQSIVTVANEKAQTKIHRYMQLQRMKPMVDYFFFC